MSAKWPLAAINPSRCASSETSLAEVARTAPRRCQRMACISRRPTCKRVCRARVRVAPRGPRVCVCVWRGTPAAMGRLRPAGRAVAVTGRGRGLAGRRACTWRAAGSPCTPASATRRSARRAPPPTVAPGWACGCARRAGRDGRRVGAAGGRRARGAGVRRRAVGRVNCAGVVVRLAARSTCPRAAVRTQLRGQLRRPLHVLQAFLPQLRAAGGRVVNGVGVVLRHLRRLAAPPTTMSVRRLAGADGDAAPRLLDGGAAAPMRVVLLQPGNVYGGPT